MKNKIFIHFGTNKITKSEFRPPWSTPTFPKPRGGLWASEYTPNWKYRSSWEEWCHDADFYLSKLDKYCLFKIKESANIYEINTEEDLVFLAQENIASIDETSNQLERDLFNILGENDFLGRPRIDFKKIIKKYDGVYLSNTCPWFVANEILMGWDVESLVLFNLDHIEIVEEV